MAEEGTLGGDKIHDPKRQPQEQDDTKPEMLPPGAADNEPGVLRGVTARKNRKTD